jgi:hypothetical protein
MPRRNLRNLKLRAIAAVDDPCQEHAKALIIKRNFSTDTQRDETVRELGKYICQDDGAHSFQECLADSKFDQNIWPCVDALSQSIRSIVGDGSLTGAERDSQIQTSVDQFLSAVRAISPEVSKRLEPLLRKEGRSMPKTVEELEKQVSELTGQLTSANALVASEKARADAAEKAKTDALSEKDKAVADCNTAKAALAAATDETISYGGEEIKKSEVGDGPFKIAKAATASEQNSRLEKRASEEFPHVVGTPTQKARILKFVDGLDPEKDETAKALLAVLKSAEKMAKLGFANLGSRGEKDPDVKKARQTYDQKVEEIRKRDEIGRAAAMSKARHRDERNRSDGSAEAGRPSHRLGVRRPTSPARSSTSASGRATAPSRSAATARSSPGVISEGKPRAITPRSTLKGNPILKVVAASAIGRGQQVQSATGGKAKAGNTNAGRPGAQQRRGERDGRGRAVLNQRFAG